MKVKDFIEMLSKYDPETQVAIRGEETCLLANKFVLTKASEYFDSEVYANQLAALLDSKEVVILEFEYD